MNRGSVIVEGEAAAVNQHNQIFAESNNPNRKNEMNSRNFSCNDLMMHKSESVEKVSGNHIVNNY